MTLCGKCSSSCVNRVIPGIEYKRLTLVSHIVLGFDIGAILEQTPEVGPDDGVFGQ